MNPQFTLGDKVKAIAFTNCFNEPVAEEPGLTVTDIRLVPRTDQPSYYRITARDLNEGGWRMVEGAERFFAKEKR